MLGMWSRSHYSTSAMNIKQTRLTLSTIQHLNSVFGIYRGMRTEWFIGCLGRDDPCNKGGYRLELRIKGWLVSPAQQDLKIFFDLTLIGLMGLTPSPPHPHHNILPCPLCY